MAREIFDDADLDGSYTVSRSELAALLQSILDSEKDPAQMDKDVTATLKVQPDSLL